MIEFCTRYQVGNGILPMTSRCVYSVKDLVVCELPEKRLSVMAGYDVTIV